MKLYNKNIQRKARHLMLFSLLVSLSSSTTFVHAEHRANSLLPPGLKYEPIQPIPEKKNLNADKVNLGKTLFNDTRLSVKNDMSCASCHRLDENGADHLQFTLGRNGVELDVNTPTVFNSNLNNQHFWDGRALNLHEQINFVVESKKEFASNWPDIVKKLKQDKNYVTSFDRLYERGISAESIRDAIVHFEKSLMTHNSPFDQYLLGDTEAINADEKKGYQLFKTYGCIACHQGSNVGGNLFMKIGVFGDFFAEKEKITKADMGRFNITGIEADRHVFRVPSLRLVALTAPYFHDGSAQTLKEAIKVMAKHQLGQEIPDQDINLIEAFLKTLPGEYQGKPLYLKHSEHLEISQ